MSKDITPEVQKEARARVISILDTCTYEQASEDLNVNQWFLWMIQDDPDYRAPAWVYNRLGFRLTPKRYRLEIALPESEEDKRKIESLSPEERLRILLQGERERITIPIRGDWLFLGHTPVNPPPPPLMDREEAADYD